MLAIIISEMLAIIIFEMLAIIIAAADHYNYNYNCCPPIADHHHHNHHRCGGQKRRSVSIYWINPNSIKFYQTIIIETHQSNALPEDTKLHYQIRIPA